MSRRNPGGTFRNNNMPTTISQRTIIARWVDAEALALKIRGFTFQRIADQITDVGRGMQRPATPLPPALAFPPNYSITAVACYKALKRALQREPQLSKHRLLQLIGQRTEQLYLACQAAIERGDPKAILVALRVLELQANVNCLNSNNRSNPPVRAAERRDEYELPTQPIISGFQAAFEVLYESGAVDRPSLESKALAFVSEGAQDADPKQGEYRDSKMR
jgi:hypothetical protein